MKKVLAIIVAIGMILSSGAAVSVMAAAPGGSNPYTDLPAELPSLPFG